MHNIAAKHKLTTISGTPLLKQWYVPTLEQKQLWPRGACGPCRSFSYILCWVIPRVWVEDHQEVKANRWGHMNKISGFFFLSTGGLASVIYTDTLQTIVMLIGSFILMGFGKWWPYRAKPWGQKSWYVCLFRLFPLYCCLPVLSGHISHHLYNSHLGNVCPTSFLLYYLSMKKWGRRT